MDNKYLGIIQQHEIDSLSVDQLVDFLEKKEYVLQRITINEALVPDDGEVGAFSVSGKIPLEHKKYVLVREIANEFYQFLLRHYRGGLGGENINFFKKFNEYTFGFNKKKTYKFGLEAFNIVFKRACPYGDEIAGQDEVTGAFISHNKFFTLNRERFQITERLRLERELFVQYLTGNAKFFDRKLFKENKLLKQMFTFENDLIILINLNRQFSFSEDEFFSIKPISLKVYDAYIDEFESLEQVRFICKQLEAKINYAFVVSLFHFFKKDLSMNMPSARVFQEIIYQYFNVSHKTIKLTDPSNLEHAKRLKILNSQWKIFNSEA